MNIDPEVGQSVYWNGEPCRIDGEVLRVKWDEHNCRVALVRWDEGTNQGTEWVSIASIDPADG